MTIKKLIDLLSSYDNELEVYAYVSDESGGYFEEYVGRPHAVWSRRIKTSSEIEGTDVVYININKGF